MVKKECSLVQNLLNDYINNFVSDDAEEVIKEHLEKCKDCNSIYMQMKNDNAQSKEQEVKRHKEYLKKFNKRLSLLKKIIIILLIIILIFFVQFAIKLIHNNYILDGVYKKLESMQNMNEYYAKREEILLYDYTSDFSSSCNITEYYYKNGKYKMVYYSKNDYENRYEVYGQEGSNEEIYVYYDSKKIEYRENHDILVYQKGQVLESIYYNISQWYIPQYKLLDLFGTYETKVYNGRECYVIRKNSTDSKSSNYNECWIDKETMMNVRNVMNTQNENTQQYRDSKIYIEEKEISDTDVELPSDLDGFDSIDS